MAQDSYSDIVRSSVFKALAEMGDRESIHRILSYFKDGEHHQGRIAASHAVARLAKDDAQLTGELLIARDFPDARVRMEAATALEEMGQSAVTNRLREWLVIEPEGRVRRRIREAIYSLDTVPH